MGAARDYIPALKYGHKIYAEDIAGMIGLPHVGNVYYVDPTSGSNSDSGTSHTAAFATIAAAYSAMTADQDDVVIIAGTGSTGRTTETAAVTWAKRRTHIVGNGPVRTFNARNGIGLYASNTASAFVISATNCSFSNISFAAFGDTDVAVEVTASYNTFNNVHFQGIGNTTPAGETGARSLLITGCGENEFNNCTIGLDTVTRTVANASLELTGSCPRNIFRGCYFPIYTSSADAVFVKSDTGNAHERFLVFENCLFNNPTTGSSTTMTVAMDLSSTGNGTVFLKDSWLRGCTDWTNTFNDLYLTMPLTDTDEGGIMKIGT